MLRWLFVIALSLAVAALALACTTGPKTDPATDDGNLGVLSAGEIVGALSYGQTSAPTPYTSVPRYRAYTFVGHAGDNVSIWVRSTDGLAYTWLQDPSSRTVAWSFATIHDTQITQQLPVDGTYFIAFRDGNLRGATFAVSLDQIESVEGGLADGGIDGGADAQLDAPINDSGGSDASSTITCTYTRTLTNAQGCQACMLPSPMTVTDMNVPVKLVNGAQGVFCTMAFPTLHSIQLMTPQVFSYWPGTSSFELWDSGMGETCVGANVATCVPSNGSCSVNITLTNGNQVDVQLNGSHSPGVANCTIIHGCVAESLSCQGKATTQ
jgi:hypothetical protein